MTRAAWKNAMRDQLPLALNYDHAIDDSDVWEAIYSHAGEWQTRQQIAQSLGRKVTPALVARIERMVAEGKLERDVFTLRNKAQGYKYRALESGE